MLRVSVKMPCMICVVASLRGWLWVWMGSLNRLVHNYQSRTLRAAVAVFLTPPSHSLYREGERRGESRQAGKTQQIATSFLWHLPRFADRCVDFQTSWIIVFSRCTSNRTSDITVPVLFAAVPRRVKFKKRRSDTLQVWIECESEFRDGTNKKNHIFVWTIEI